LSAGDLIAAQQDSYHGQGSFPTSLWLAGAAFCDRWPLAVRETALPTDQTELVVGLVRRSGERLPAWDAAGQPLGDHVRFAGPAVVLPEGGRRLSYHWGRRLRLTDYEMGPTVLRPGESFTLTLHWQGLATLPADYVATVQVLDEAGGKVAQSDAPPLAAGQPPSAWPAGTRALDRRTLAVDPAAAPGVYQVYVGVYDPGSVQNLPLFRGREAMLGGGLLPLWGLRVLPR
ncbi:MAG: hypothetical protein GX605_01095, partial [Chloroflexi bacterium]|nr:hypothetical protein [Chloroflexota bacterium]